MEYRLELVRVFVHDWEQTLAFYTETLGMPVAFSSAEMGWAQLGTEGAQLAIERLDRDDPEAAGLVGRFVGVSLTVDDVGARHEALVSRGVRFLEPPAQQPWGAMMAHFEDPEGNVLTLIGPGASAVDEGDA